MGQTQFFVGIKSCLYQVEILYLTMDYEFSIETWVKVLN